MKARLSGVLFVSIFILYSAVSAQAQELGPGFHKIKDGIYTFAPDATTTTCSFVVTQEGVVMIDSCNSPLDSRKMAAAIKKVTDKPDHLSDRHGDAQRSYGQSFYLLAARHDHKPPGSRGRDEKRIRPQTRRNTRSEIPRDAGRFGGL